MVVLKNTIFTILVPGTVTVLIPYWVLTRNFVAMPSPWGIPQYLWDFASVGKGTPAPVDPPKVLVRYAIGAFVIFHLFVIVYEEPSLRRKFGESYERYCRNVRRWVPGKKYHEIDLRRPPRA